MLFFQYPLAATIRMAAKPGLHRRSGLPRRETRFG